MPKLKFIPCALLVLSHGAFAAQPPSAGSQMQQIPPTPMPQIVAPKLGVQPGGSPASSTTDDVTLTVHGLRVTGAQVYSESQLLTLTGFKPGSDLTVPDLRAMAAKIADHYHRNGYFLAQVYLPEQDIKDGIVTIAVLEGRYGKVVLNNQTRVATPLAGTLLSGLDSGDTIRSAPLENRLLLLSDLPGVKVSSTLVPGAATGTSDLMVDLTPGQRISGSIDADNAGNRYTGANRIGATVNFNEPLGNGDVASLRVLSSGAGLNYVRGAYQMQFGKARAGVSYSALRYVLGEEFESLGAHGTAEVASVYASYPLLRTRQTNLYVGLAFDGKIFHDHIDSTDSVSDKKAQVAMVSLNGDHVGGGGTSAYAMTWSSGTIDLQTPAVRTLDAMTAQSNGHFNKLAYSATRLQSVTGPLSLSASVNGQIASKNLDVSEKMELGGMYGVRAYPEGEAYGDEGYVLNLEARLLLPRFSERMAGQLQLVGFVDTGRINVNRNPWSSGPNRRTLSGAGVGLIWSDSNNFLLRAYYAVKVGDETATSAPDASGRFWIQAVKYF